MEKRKNNILIYSVGVILVFFLFFTVKSYLPTGQLEEEHNQISGFPPILTGTTEDGDVAIELKPIEVSKTIIRLEISANTHSVDLSPFNLREIVTLASNGKEFNPVSAPQLSGHHAAGELIFEGDFDSKSFSVIIKNIPLVNERIFSW